MTRWYPAKRCCDADRTYQSTVREASRSGLRKRSQMVMHIRGEERFWHWKDQLGDIQGDSHDPRIDDQVG